MLNQIHLSLLSEGQYLIWTQNIVLKKRTTTPHFKKHSPRLGNTSEHTISIPQIWQKPRKYVNADVSISIISHNSYKLSENEVFIHHFPMLSLLNAYLHAMSSYLVSIPILINCYLPFQKPLTLIGHKCFKYIPFRNHCCQHPYVKTHDTSSLIILYW